MASGSLGGGRWLEQRIKEVEGTQSGQQGQEMGEKEMIDRD